MSYTLEKFLADFILTWEGKLSLDKTDPGNFYKGKLVGSNYGVTGAALAAHRGKEITADDMKNLTLDEAVDIAKSQYVIVPGFDNLPWNQVTASVIDFGYNAGPGRAKKKLQEMISTTADGNFGPASIAAYNKFLATHGIEDAAKRWNDVRENYYNSLVAAKPAMSKYIKGWINRTRWYAPGTTFWKKW